jgi:hypothetical protein
MARKRWRLSLAVAATLLLAAPAASAAPPVVTVTTPPDQPGLTYQRDAVVAIDFACTDPDAPPAPSCDASLDGVAVDDGDPLDTSAVGTHTLTVTANDGGGAPVVVTRSYTVAAPPAPPAGGGPPAEEPAPAPFPSGLVPDDPGPPPEPPPAVPFLPSLFGDGESDNVPAFGKATRVAPASTTLRVRHGRARLAIRNANAFAVRARLTVSGLPSRALTLAADRTTTVTLRLAHRRPTLTATLVARDPAGASRTLRWTLRLR